MYNNHHKTSHMRCGVELVDNTPVTLRRHLEVYLKAAENKMKNALRSDMEAMWLRGWEQYREVSEQIRLLDAVMQ